MDVGAHTPEQQSTGGQDPTPNPSATPPSAGRARKVLSGVAIAAAVAVGGLTVAAVNPLGSAGAQETTTSTAPAAQGGSGATGAHRSSKVVDDALASLVKDGTLTQAQADAVRTRLQETAKAVHADRKANRQERRQDVVATAAGALGISADELKAQVKDGRTIAQIAQDRGVEVAKVTDALVAEADKLIDQAATDGKVDAAKVDALKQKAAERIQRFVQDGPRRRG